MAGGPSEVERLCEAMHVAYERAAAGAGWETQQASRKPWADVPEPNRVTMRAAVRALLAAQSSQANLGLATTRDLLAELTARIEVDGYVGGGGLDYSTVAGRPGLPPP